MDEKEFSAWSTFVEVVKKFSGKRSVQLQYKEIAANLLSSLQDVGATMSTKL